jgi:hypothetical protein
VAAPTGPAAPVAGVAAGVGTFMAVDSFMRWMIDNGFELVRPAGSQPPAQQQNQNQNRPVPTAPSAVPELTPQSSVVVPNSPVQVGSINKSVNMSPVAMKINSNSPEQLAATNATNQKLDMLATAMSNSTTTQKNLEQLLANQLEIAISQRDNTRTLVGYNADQADYLRGINRSVS